MRTIFEATAANGSIPEVYSVEFDPHTGDVYLFCTLNTETPDVFFLPAAVLAGIGGALARAAERRDNVVPLRAVGG